MPRLSLLPYIVVMLIGMATAAAQVPAVGHTTGSFALSPSGAATYTIPLFAPPGPNGLQPHLMLIYDSQFTGGSIGQGWTLAGLSSIYRCNRTYAQDGTPAAVALSVTDGYCLDGQRLRVTSGLNTYGLTGSTYQTEVANFANVTASGTAGNGPAYFTVQLRNGLIYEYGNPANSSNAQVLATGTTTPTSWMLDKVTDRAGNTMVIQYLPASSNLQGTTVPAEILWTPISHGASTYVDSMVFNYGANVQASTSYGYVAGTYVTNDERLLSIQLEVSGTTVKDYFLSYQASATTGRSQLVSITECSDSGESNCVTPSTFSYQQPTAGVSTTASQGPSNASPGNTWTTFDFNGDGINDVAYCGSGATIWVALGSSTGTYGNPINSGADCSYGANFADMTGSGKTGILAEYGSNYLLYYYSLNGSAFTGTWTGVNYPYNLQVPWQWTLADIDGDGRPDLITASWYNNSYQIYINKNTSTTGAPSFSTSATLAYNSAVNGTIGSGGYDFNGDGLEDLSFVSGLGGTYELMSNGSTFAATELNATGAQSSVYFFPFNSDRCTDAITSTTIYISACNGAVASTITIPGTTSMPATYTLVGVIDWNGDSLPDLLVTDSMERSLYVYLSTGNGLSPVTATGLSFDPNASYFGSDLTGSGLQALVTLTSGGMSYYPHNDAGTTPDLMSQARDGYGNSVALNYEPIAQGNYQNGTDASFPDRNYSGPFVTVSRATFSDPSAPGATYYQTFSYTDAWTNLQGRGFEGFEEISTYDSRTGPLGIQSNNQYFELAFPYTGMPYQLAISTGLFNVDQWIATPEPLQSITLDGTANNERYEPYFGSAVDTRREFGGSENGVVITTTATTKSLDSYGNVTSESAVVTDNDPSSPYSGQSWTTSTTNTTDIATHQASDAADWCIGIFDETQVNYSSSLSGSTSVTRTKTFTPDTPQNCRILTITTEPANAPYTVTESLNYDSFGNVSQDTVTGGNMPASPASRVTQRNWGTTGQFLQQFDDPSGAVTTRQFVSPDSLAFGLPDNMTDPNQLETRWQYDSFGRTTQETRPDNTYTIWAASLCSANCGYGTSTYQVNQTVYQTNGTAIRTDTTLFDPIDRAVETSGPSVSGAAVIVQKAYNSMGLLAQQSFPFLSGSTAYEQTYSYDGLGRLASLTQPTSASNAAPLTTSYSYAGRTTVVTDFKGNAKTSVADVNGWLRQTKDAVGYQVSFAYDAAGSKTAITDSTGKTLWSIPNPECYIYGLQPFLLCATDKDLGSWSYTVDSLGEVIGWQDAKGKSFSATYDALSRMTSRSDPDPFVTQWTWGSSPTSHNVGQVIGECTGAAIGTLAPCTTNSTAAIYSEVEAYDTLGRLASQSITLNGNAGNDNGAFLYTMGYDSSSGLLRTVTYPTSTYGNRLTIQYGYSSGILQSVTDTSDATSTCGVSCTLWTLSLSSSSGLLKTQETLGNGIVVSRAYDAVNNWLSAATAGIGGGASALNQSYLYDQNANVEQRQDNNRGLTENFWYDANNRLTCAVTTSTCPIPTVTYDASASGPGNITAKTDSAGALASYTVNWSTYNYPLSITAGAESVQFAYGPDRQRWQQVYTDGGATETTDYIGGLLEEVFSGGIVDYRHYIYAGKQPIAMYSRRSTAANTFHYLLSDNQGSVSAITNSSGTAEVAESFTPHGNRRNPTTWTGSPSDADLTTIGGITREGYTFQTGLGVSMGLNHMNGRVQDSTTGRFLSPDPNIPDPLNAEDYNRYAYVDNNPLSLSDPSGFDESAGEYLCRATYGVMCDDPSTTIYDPHLGGAWFGGLGSSSGYIAFSFESRTDNSIIVPKLDFCSTPTCNDGNPHHGPFSTLLGSVNLLTGQTSSAVSWWSPGNYDLSGPLAAYGSEGAQFNYAINTSLHVYYGAVKLAALIGGFVIDAPADVVAAVRGGAAAVRIGQAGEAAVRAAYDIGPATRIVVNGVDRIPDGLTGRVLSEVKNVGSLSYTRQLRDFATFAKTEGLQFNLYVRSNTQLSPPLLEAIRAGEITLLRIPGL